MAVLTLCCSTLLIRYPSLSVVSRDTHTHTHTRMRCEGAEVKAMLGLVQTPKEHAWERRMSRQIVMLRVMGVVCGGG